MHYFSNKSLVIIGQVAFRKDFFKCLSWGDTALFSDV